MISRGMATPRQRRLDALEAVLRSAERQLEDSDLRLLRRPATTPLRRSEEMDASGDAVTLLADVRLGPRRLSPSWPAHNEAVLPSEPRRRLLADSPAGAAGQLTPPPPPRSPEQVVVQVAPREPPAAAAWWVDCAESAMVVLFVTLALLALAARTRRERVDVPSPFAVDDSRWRDGSEECRAASSLSQTRKAQPLENAERAAEPAESVGVLPIDALEDVAAPADAAPPGPDAAVANARDRERQRANAVKHREELRALQIRLSSSSGSSHVGMERVSGDHSASRRSARGRPGGPEPVAFGKPPTVPSAAQECPAASSAARSGGHKEQWRHGDSSSTWLGRETALGAAGRAITTAPPVEEELARFASARQDGEASLRTFRVEREAGVAVAAAWARVAASASAVPPPPPPSSVGQRSQSSQAAEDKEKASEAPGAIQAPTTVEAPRTSLWSANAQCQELRMSGLDVPRHLAGVYKAISPAADGSPRWQQQALHEQGRSAAYLYWAALDGGCWVLDSDLVLKNGVLGYVLQKMDIEAAAALPPSSAASERCWEMDSAALGRFVKAPDVSIVCLPPRR